MPRVSEFFGIVILMFTNEGTHFVRHFHAVYGGYEASVAFDGTVLAGELPRRQLKLVQKWAALHQNELAENWQLARAGQGVQRISPLA